MSGARQHDGDALLQRRDRENERDEQKERQVDERIHVDIRLGALGASLVLPSASQTHGLSFLKLGG